MVFLVNIGVCIHVFLTTRRLFILDHPEIVWYRVLHLGQIHYGAFKYLPLLSGGILALIQYLPEMWQQRLRLGLHLPVPPHRLILIHMGVGLIALGLAMLPVMMTLSGVILRFFPLEALQTAVVTVLPWFFAGIAAYLGGALVLLEPDLKRKAYNLIVAAGTAGLYLQPAEPGQYAGTIILMVLPLGLMIVSVFLPVYRFRYRRTA